MIYLSPPTEGGTAKGLIKMTAYTTRALAIEVIGDDSKTATRTLRKFLRDDTTAKGGKVGIDTPGKGGRYSLDLTKPQLRKLIKDFKLWEVAQEEAKAKRAADLAAKGAIILPADDSTDEEALATNEESDNAPEGPSDEEIAAMLSDDDEHPEGDEPDNIGEDYSV